MTTGSKRTGRPLKEHAPGTMTNITLQVTAEMKMELQERALAANRTLSKECELALLNGIGSPWHRVADRFGRKNARMAHIMLMALDLLDMADGAPLKITMQQHEMDAIQAAAERIKANVPILNHVPAVDRDGGTK